MKIDPNSPAFPVMHSIDGNWVKDPKSEFLGMPIRLAIAAQIMSGFAATSTSEDPLNDAKSAARGALELADALIAAYNKGQP